MVRENIENDTANPEDEIEKRKPKPFRYVSNMDEIVNNDSETIINKSVMTDEQTTSKKLLEQFESTVGVGDIDTIEQVLRKHEQKRNIEKSIDIT